MGKSSKQTKKDAGPATVKKEEATTTTPKQEVVKDVASDHLPPLGLVFTVIACSGFLFVFAFRDVFATGRNIAGDLDETFLQFTKSIEFFDDSKGWKSKQGGLSTIAQVTTDANNMGGLFVRKMGGAAFMALQIQKLMPMLVHPVEARWKHGHFRPMLWTAVITNMLMAAFYGLYLGELEAAGAQTLPTMFIIVLVVEAVMILSFLHAAGTIERGPAKLMENKTPDSVPSRIVARTVAMCSGAMMLIAGRDLFFPGYILKFIPRDDIYLEWTGALLHSPPDGSVEAREEGYAAALYIGDKFLSQHMALCILLLCLYKVVSSFFIRYGSDGGGMAKARIIWKAQSIADGLVLFLFRLFTSAASSASLDIRWHLMIIAYEAGVFFLCGYL
eukprot:Nitzschia sp. Nitz4//scaffold166_size90379//70452//71706//NITZ4_005069-RA/size90379-augustus-gene-0.6-mRNA-1//1//CDS//3329538232//684//frame0